MAKKNNFTVVRNGEYIAVFGDKDSAEKRIKSEKAFDAYCYQIGWTKASPDTISYHISYRK